MGPPSLPRPHPHLRPHRLAGHQREPNDRPRSRAPPQDPADARSFRRITTVFVAAALLGAFALLVLLNDGYATFAAHPEPYRAVNMPDKWLQDVVVPWSAGATLPPVIPLTLIGLAVHLTTVHRRLFRLRSHPPRQRERARAVADYAGAPMVLLLPAVVWWCGLELFFYLSNYPRAWFFTHLLATGVVLALPAWLLLGAGVLLSIVRITQWSTRARGAGLERTVIDVPYLLGLWSLGLIVWLLILPWCVGFFWIVIDSLR